MRFVVMESRFTLGCVGSESWKLTITGDTSHPTGRCSITPRPYDVPTAAGTVRGASASQAALHACWLVARGQLLQLAALWLGD